MFSLLLAIIYIAFISLGLPDSLLGSAWPVLHTELNVPLSYQGIITVIIASGTVISSLFSDRLTRKLGTGLVTAISVLMTAVGLFGFSISNSFVFLCLFAIPYGLGAGAVDAALNNFVALHYSSRSMSWLHCFWGIGASISPFIMGLFLTNNNNWSGGYLTVAIIQIALCFILFMSLPLWKKANKEIEETSTEEKKVPPVGIIKAIKIPGVAFVLITFFAYCALESTTGLWVSTYLFSHRGLSESLSSMFGALFFIGITVGRFLSGFIANKVGDKNMIRYGLVILTVGIILILIPFASVIPALVGLMITGLGCAPIYPSIIHATPTNFGKDKSQSIIGIQMASAYIGSTLMPPLFGIIADYISSKWLPVYLVIFAITMIVASEALNRLNKRKHNDVLTDSNIENL